MAQNDPTMPVAAPAAAPGQISQDMALIGLADFARSLFTAASDGKAILETMIAEVQGEDWKERTRSLLLASRQALSDAEASVRGDGCAFGPSGPLLVAPEYATSELDPQEEDTFWEEHEPDPL